MFYNTYMNTGFKSSNNRLIMSQLPFLYYYL